MNMIFFRKYMIGPGLLACLALLLQCESASISQKKSKATGKFGGTFVVGIPNDIDTFNPLFTEAALGKEIGHLVLRGLADLNEESDFTGELAESWERSADYLHLTWHLRKNARWADNVRINAEDVLFTFDLLKDTTVASPNQWVTENIQKITAIDSFTVQIDFIRAYPDQIFDTASEILPKHLLKDVDRKSFRSHPFGQQPLASGPYKLSKWVAQQYIELVPNENYYGRRPYLDKLIFKIVPDKTSLLMQLQAGEVNMIVDVDADNARQMKQKSQAIQIHPISGRIYYYIGYNIKNPLFASAEVRRALTMAVDRKKITDALLFGFGETCAGPIPPMLHWELEANTGEIPFNPDAAKKMLTASGWVDSNRDGWLDLQKKTFEFTLQVNSGNQLKGDLAVVVQEQLRKVGVKVNIETIETTTMMKMLRQKDFDAYVGGWSTSFNVDFTPIFHSQSEDLFNYGGYANAEVDRLIEAGRAEMDRDHARAIWTKAQQLIYQEQPYTFLFWKPKIVAVDARFKNVTPIPLSMLYNVENWYLDDPNGTKKLSAGNTE